MKTFSGFRVARHLEIGILVAAATLGFATSAQARVLLGSPGPAALSNGLVGYWPLDGAVTNWNANTTADISGRGSTGRLVGMSTSSSPVAGKIGQALKFNGQSSRVALPNIAFSTPFSISEWVYLGAIQSNNTFFSINTSCTLYIDSSGLLAYWNAGSTGSNDFGFTFPISSLHHVVYVFSNSAVTAYVDGSQSGTLTSTFNCPGSVPAEIGSSVGNSEYFSGKLDDVRIYNRALSATEVKQLYKLGTANAAHSNTVSLSNGLVGYWPLDGAVTNWATGQTRDLSGSGNTGQLIELPTPLLPWQAKSARHWVFTARPTT